MGESAVHSIQVWALQNGVTAGVVDDAMQAVIDSIGDNPPDIDYKHRRDALGKLRPG
jgi:hypothetical protein